jgi:threonine dehydrogenase-like Zn-dependent dehydrogenase
MVEIGERPDPVIQEPTDAVVRVVLGCVCGSDLWYYRGESAHAVGSIGHEFIGVVEQAGAEVRGVRAGRPGDRAVHLQRHVLPALPERVDHLLSRRGELR